MTKKYKCTMCGDIIFNKGANSSYCKKCSEASFDIRSNINNIAWLMKRKYTNYCIKTTIKISKK